MGLGHGWTSGGGAGSVSGQAITPSSVTTTGDITIGGGDLTSTAAQSFNIVGALDATTSSTVPSVSVRPGGALTANDLVFAVQTAAGAGNVLTVDYEGDTVAGGSVTAPYIAASDSSLGFYMGGSNVISRDGNTGTWVIVSSEDASAITATRPAWGIKSVRNLNAQTLLFGLADNGSTNYVFTVAKEGTLGTDFTDDSANTGNRTVNKPSGISAFAAASAAITITNSCCIASTSRVFAMLQTNDATATSIKSVVPSAGSFIINVVAAATGTTKVAWFVVN